MYLLLITEEGVAAGAEATEDEEAITEGTVQSTRFANESRFDRRICRHLQFAMAQQFPRILRRRIHTTSSKLGFRLRLFLVTLYVDRAPASRESERRQGHSIIAVALALEDASGFILKWPSEHDSSSFLISQFHAKSVQNE